MTSFSGELRERESLSHHTYYKIGGPAKLLAIPRSLEDLEWLAKKEIPNHKNVLILGKGSNALVSDNGFSGLVIKTSRMNNEVRQEGNFIRAGAGVAISNFLRKCGENGWAGLEFLTGVPGSMGGAAWMNAGTHVGETRDRIQEVEVYSLKECVLKKITKDDLEYSYRKNHFLGPLDVVWSTLWGFEKGNPKMVKSQIEEMLKRRKDTQPVEGLSCGSVFKNPKGTDLRAWQVIDKLGLRGFTVGKACFSEKHSNFIVNTGGAKASDVKELIDTAKKRAKTELGINLEEEVRLIGF